jgi:hypothetical protein
MASENVRTRADDHIDPAADALVEHIRTIRVSPPAAWELQFLSGYVLDHDITLRVNSPQVDVKAAQSIKETQEK